MKINIKVVKLTVFCAAMIAFISVMVGCSANRIILVGPSHHFHTKGKTYNDNNYGIGFESDIVGITFYQNSVGNDSLAAYRKFRTTDYSQIFAGVVSGYDDNFIPFFANVFTLGDIRLLTSFPVGKLTGKSDVLNLQYEWKF